MQGDSARSPAVAFAVVALVALYLLLSGATFATFLIDPDLAALTWLGLLALALAGAWRLLRDPSLRGLPVVLSLLYLALLLLATLTAVYPRGAAEGLAFTGLELGLFWLALQLGRRADTREAALAGLLVATVPIAVRAAGEGLGQVAPAVTYLTEFGRARAMATLNHPNNFAGFVALVLPLVVAAAWVARGRGRPLVLALLAGLVVLLLYGDAATFSKGGQVALLVSLVALAAQAPAGGWRAWWRADPRRAAALSGVGAVMVVLLAVLFWHSPAAARLRHFIDLLPTLRRFERWGTWLAAGRMIAAHPWTGVGPEGFGLLMAQYKAPGSNTELYTHAHNWFLQLAAEQGLPALGVFLALSAVAVRNAWRAARETTDQAERRLLAGLVAGLVGFLYAGLLDYNVGVPSIGLTWWFLLGLTAGARTAPVRRPAPVGWGVFAVAVGLVGLSLVWLGWNRGHVAYQQVLGAVREGRWRDAEAALARARGLDPAQRAYALVAADLAVWTGRPGDAVRQLEALSTNRRPPLDAAYLDRLAWLYTAQNDVAYARQMVLPRAERAAPAEAVLRVDEGFLATLSGADAEATRQFEAALRLQPEAAGALVGLALVRDRHGDRPGAMAALHEAAALSFPRDRVPRFLIAYHRVDPLALLPAATPLRRTLDRPRWHGAEGQARLQALAAGLTASSTPAGWPPAVRPR